MRAREFDGYLVPIAFQFFRDQHREASGTALAHFRLCHANNDGVVTLDDDPSGDLRITRRSYRGSCAERNVEAECKRAARSDDAGEERAAIDLTGVVHAHPDFQTRVSREERSTRTTGPLLVRPHPRRGGGAQDPPPPMLVL